jgi:hypothetical protein
MKELKEILFYIIVWYWVALVSGSLSKKVLNLFNASWDSTIEIVIFIVFLVVLGLFVWDHLRKNKK